MKKKFSFTVTAIACIALLGGGTLSAQASEVSAQPQEIDIEGLRSFFDGYAVPLSVQDSLLLKLKNGEKWDSFIEGVEPIRTDIQEKGNVNTTVSTYPDGSLSVSTADKANNSLSRAWGCRYNYVNSTTSKWTGCNVNVNLGIIKQGFMLDFEKKGNTSRITRYFGHYWEFYGGSLTNHRLVPYSSTRVRYNADLSVAFQGFPVGWTSWMQANLNGITITTSNN